MGELADDVRTFGLSVCLSLRVRMMWRGCDTADKYLSVSDVVLVTDYERVVWTRIEGVTVL